MSDYQVSNVDDSQVYEEATGIIEGILLEDFVVTAAKVGKPYCAVGVEAMGWTKAFNIFPLTYVPFLAMAQNLKKGSHVQIKFQQDDIRFPYLWLNHTNFPIPTANAKQASSGDGVLFPGVSGGDEYSFNILGDGLIVASSSGYVAVRYESGNDYQIVFFFAGGMTVYSSGNVGVHAAGKVGVHAAEIDLNGNTHHFVTQEQLQSAVDGLMAALNTHAHTSSPIGPPGPPLTQFSMTVPGTTTIKTGG